jgi:hypothetical protein
VSESKRPASIRHPRATTWENELKSTVQRKITVLALVLAPIFLALASLAIPLQASTRPGLIGVSVHSLTTQEADFVKLANAQWVRADVAELPSEYSFADIVTNAKNRGIKVLGLLDIWTMKWNWNFTTKDWEIAVRTSVAQHKDNVDAWEIWNEPEYPSNPITAERYFEMLRTAYSIIKEYAPHSEVLMGGGLNLNTGGDPWLARDQAFAKRLSELGAEQYADGISFHAYPWTNKIADWVWQRYDESLGFYRSLFKKHLEVWITETGYPAEVEGETSQSAYLAKAVSFFGQRSADAVFWYELRDTAYSNPTPTFGLLTETLTPRPAFYSLQALLT